MAKGTLQLGILAGWACAAWAQSPVATITGTVSDPQGARVPGAEVVARNMGTNLTFRAIASGEGTYAINSLPVGRYDVRIAASGFKTFERTGLTLEVAQRLRLDAQLDVGAATETVSVVAEVPRVQTEDSALGTVVERKRIEELPLNGRHIFNLVKLVAGVQPRNSSSDGFADANNQAFSQIRFSGGPIYGNQVLLDGGSNTVPVHNEVSVVPMVDAIEEFRVETNSLKAEFGQSNGGVINVVSKAGTNRFHGSLYEFVRNDSLDARNAFATQRDPRTGRIKPTLRYNQYGGTAGGPVRIPKVYDGRNRTFFFGGYEQWRHRSATIRQSTVSTPLERSGDFSNTRNGLGQLIPIFDPATTRANPAGSGFVRDPMPGNLVPRGRFDPLSLKVLEFMPLPNARPNNDFANTLNFLSLQSSPLDQGVTNVRVDHRFDDRNNVFFRYSGTRNTRQDRGWGLGPSDPSARNDQRDNHNAVASYDRTFTPTMLNNFRMSATRQYLPFLHPSFDEGWPAKLGYPSIVPQDQFPPVTITGVLDIGSSGFSGGNRSQHTVQLVDAFTWIRGNHNVKAGIDHKWSRLSFINRSQPSGRFDFGSALTNNPQQPQNTGVGLATFLMGEVSGGSIGVRPFFAFHAWMSGLYVQDDWKLTPRLTLNLGMRYDKVSAPVERWNRHSNFDPWIPNSSTGTLGVMTYSGVTAPRAFVDRDKNNFGPRIGFAWDPRGKGRTSVRGGYGILYVESISSDTVGDNSNAFGFSIDTPFVAPGGGPFKAFQLSVGPTALIQPLGANGGPNAFRGLDVRYQDRNAPTPYLQQWNFTLQQALGKGWVASASYVGNKGTKLFGGNHNLNQLDPANFSQRLALQDMVTNPFFGQIATGVLSGRTVARSTLLRPFPDYNSVSTYASHGASSIYHSLQVTVEKRYSNGLTFLGSYTNGKLINDAFSSLGGGSGGDGDFRLGRFNRRLERAIDQDDISQRMVLSGVWELPVPKKGALWNGVLHGWQLNGISTMQTGAPLLVRGANNFTGINWPDTAGNPTLPGGERGVLRWFNTEAFRNPVDWTIGNVPRTLPDTRGPGLFELSGAIFKTFAVFEGGKLEFRAEAFNATNNVNLNDPNVSFSPNRDGVNTNPNFGRITAAGAARRVQLGLRLAF